MVEAEADTAARDKNLAKANKIRIGRADLKRKLKAGRDPRRWVEQPPVVARGMRTEEFLMAMPMVGRKRANRILNDAGIKNTRTLGNLAPLQREALVEALRELREGEERRR